MPLMTEREIAKVGRIGLWQIGEPETWFLNALRLFGEEEEMLSKINGQRRTEWLAGRMLAHRLSGHLHRHPCLNAPSGKPFFSGDVRTKLSLSHSSGMAAAFVSDHFRIGIDVQKIVRKIDKIAPRFMTPEEIACLDNHNRIEHIHVFWGAKESLYKADGRQRLDLRRHIRILPFSLNQNGGEIQGIVTAGQSTAYFTIQYECLGDYMLVYCYESVNSISRVLPGSGKF